MSQGRLSHIDPSGNARMIDVGGKDVTRRTATASCVCHMNLATAESVRANSFAKGDVLQVARLAAIGAAKRTDELIPLCHSIPLDIVEVDFQWMADTRLEITVTSIATGKTGVEMEAMVAASIAGLTVYDMCKSSDRAMKIEDVKLLSKSGGVRGDYTRSET